MWNKRDCTPPPIPPPHGVVLLPSVPVPQYICIKLPKADHNARAHKNDVNTLS